MLRSGGVIFHLLKVIIKLRESKFDLKYEGSTDHAQIIRSLGCLKQKVTSYIMRHTWSISWPWLPADVTLCIWHDAVCIYFQQFLCHFHPPHEAIHASVLHVLAALYCTGQRCPLSYPIWHSWVCTHMTWDTPAHDIFGFKMTSRQRGAQQAGRSSVREKRSSRRRTSLLSSLMTSSHSPSL